MTNIPKLVVVAGATGQQGGAVVRALQRNGRFRVRALTRNPDKHQGLADEVVLADLDRPETLKAAFDGAYGAFLVTNSWEAGAAEPVQAVAAIHAAKAAGVSHLVWSTLPDVDRISGGAFDVPHFTAKANVERFVSEVGFTYHTFVIAPFYYQNLLGVMAPQKQANGTAVWALPLDPERRVMHVGDIGEIGELVAGAFAQPNLAGHGEHLPLVGDFLSFNEIVSILDRQGHRISFHRVSRKEFVSHVPHGEGIAAMFAYFEAHTYLGSDSRDAIALADRVAGRQPTKFADWARTHFATQLAA